MCKVLALVGYLLPFTLGNSYHLTCFAKCARCMTLSVLETMELFDTAFIVQLLNIGGRMCFEIFQINFSVLLHLVGKSL